MKLNEIDFNLLNDKELISICLKYNLIKREEISNYTRSDILKIIKNWLSLKLRSYGHKNKDQKK